MNYDDEDEEVVSARLLEEARANGGRHPLYPNFGAAEIRSSTPKRDPQREHKESSHNGFWD